tara:strand:- start:1338 stop:1649 length:312 start_codon:yes stop_codon:yes gene_type:complete
MSKQQENSHGSWDNQQFKDAWNSLSVKEQEEYKRAGEYMYNNKNVDYEQNFDNVLKESAFYIIEGIKSGLHPSDLDKDEKKVLKEVYGDKWYVEYGYTKKDLD